MPKLKVVEFQTVSYCNSDCLICPWSQLKKHATLKYMDEKTWANLLSGLKDMQPDRIIPYLNNEPLLDKNIFSKIEVLKNTVPHCTMELSTNASLMSPDIIEKLAESPLNDILISVFGHDRESQKRIMGKNVPYEKVVYNVLQLKKALDQTRNHKNLAIVKVINSPYTSQEDIIKNKSFWQDHGISVYEYGYLDRAGNIGTNCQRNADIKPYGCELNRHNERMYLYFDGEAYLCCHDWRRRFSVGNINTSSLHDIWESENYTRLRMMVNGKLDSDKNFLCRSCKLCPVEAQ